MSNFRKWLHETPVIIPSVNTTTMGDYTHEKKLTDEPVKNKKKKKKEQVTEAKGQNIRSIGDTSVNVGHSHTAYVDENGNGHTTVGFGKDVDNHEHEIVALKIVPNGVDGSRTHTHSL